MKEETKVALIDAIVSSPAISRAAITGSQASGGAPDQHSDIDLLLIAHDLNKDRLICDLTPRSWNVLICAFHLTHYCTILLDDLEKIDLAIFSADDPPSSWVIHDYTVIKGDSAFEADLAKAATATRTIRAAHLNQDVSVENVLLLLITASKRIGRGELLSAHAFIAMAADMLICLERRRQPPEADADLLDPRRRLEKNCPDFARILHQSLFAPPDRGVRLLAEHLSARHRGSMSPGQLRALEHLFQDSDNSLRTVRR